jgi:uncharacterized protein YpmB
MKNESASPEERLFKIIQQEKQSSPAVGKPSREKSAAVWLKKLKEKIVLPREKITSLVQGSIGKARAVFSGKSDDISLQAINKTLSVLLIILTVSALYYAVAKYPNTAKRISAAAKVRKSISLTGEDIEQFKTVDYYTGDAVHRDIFNAKHGESGAGAAITTTGASKGSAGDFKLQGIAWSDVPKVMIQVGKEDKVYVLKESQVIGSTGVRVKTILKNKVILTDGARDFEL